MTNPVESPHDGALRASAPARDAGPAGTSPYVAPAGSTLHIGLPISSQETASPDALDASGEGVDLCVRISPAVALILRLVQITTDLSHDEIIARAIGHYALHLGVPALARDMTVDLSDLPEMERSAPNRFRGGGP